MDTLNKLSAIITVFCLSLSAFADLPYTIVDTGQIRCYDDTTEIKYPKADAKYFGQDAHYNGNQASYKDNGDGTVSDNNTGLMWTQDPGRKMTHNRAVAGASKCKVGGYDDWRLPTIKELYSLILFSGTDPDPMSVNTSSQKPFIDASFFDFQYGNVNQGERIIDSQFATSTIYRSTTMHGNKTMFGVNFADGRIKGYPIGKSMGRRPEKTYHVLYVRANSDYGKNDFKDNGNGTITDKATGLMWMKVDSGKLKAGNNKDGKMNWQEALDWAEKLGYAGHSDWRLPNAKELHSIIDYSRCPDVTDSAAIAPVFDVTAIRNEGGKKDYPSFWTSTTHAKVSRASSAVYIAFGRALGFLQDRRTGGRTLMDVHGAGAQRADAKSGDPSRFPQGRGPQGDVMRIYHHVRCVRGGEAVPRTNGPKVEMKPTARGQRPGGFGGMMGESMGPPPRGNFVRRLDRNGDGKVSRSEFDGPAEHFGHLDRNRDGFLSEQEAPTGPPPGRNGRRGGRNRER